jgi:AcrR family transcriptional regulator
MPKLDKEKHKNTLEPRRLPMQQRAKKRTREILDITAQLLEEVGIDDLTTILIAKELGISVGSLYHYFPNKHAILYTLGASWLEEMTSVLEQIERFNFNAISLKEFVDEAVDRMNKVYKTQRAVLPLAQALWSIPELRDLDRQHDQLIISKMAGIFERLGFDAPANELNRLGRAYLELTHALLLVVVEQKALTAKRTLADLKRLVFVLLEPYQKEHTQQ